MVAGVVLRRRGTSAAVARQAGRPSRPRADPDAVTAMDMQGTALEPTFSDAGLWKKAGAGKSGGKSGSSDEEVDFEAIKVAEAKAAEDDEELQLLLKLTPVERADIIDEISRKAFVLMEAGEIKEAREHLDRVTRIGAAFQRLDEVQNPGREKKEEPPPGEKKKAYSEGEDAVLNGIRKELHKEDFLDLFAGRWSHFIGSW